MKKKKDKINGKKGVPKVSGIGLGSGQKGKKTEKNEILFLVILKIFEGIENNKWEKSPLGGEHFKRNIELLNG